MLLTRHRSLLCQSPSRSESAPLGHAFGFVLVKLDATFSARSTRKLPVDLPRFRGMLSIWGQVVRSDGMLPFCVETYGAPSGATAFSGSGMCSGTTLAAGAVSLRTMPCCAISLRLLRYGVRPMALPGSL